MKEEIVLGTKVYDVVTFFEGTAVARVEYLYGSPRIQVERMSTDGKLRQEWFEEDRLLPKLD